MTAADRPYKKPRPLSECFRILAAMRNNQHLDSDLFDLFLRSGVWKDYANRFLHPDQIDEPDISLYVRSPADGTGPTPSPAA